MNASNWSIEYSCPQCGAPLQLEETDRLAACPYCRTSVYLVAESAFRYLLPAAQGLNEELYFIPYWRIKGFTFLLQLSGVTNRFTDTNLLSLRQKGLPFSLGLRPQAMKLRFVTPQVSGHFLKSDRTVQDLLPLIISQSGENPPMQAFIGETVSQIFTPVYFRQGLLYDAVLKRPLSTIPGTAEAIVQSAREEKPWQVSFVSTLCPHCGCNLEGEKGALVLLCRNCRSLWQCRETSLERVSFATLTDGPEARHYLPFWRMNVRIEGTELASKADLIRLANLPRAITPELERTPLFFWSPAFKIQAVQFLRWSQQMTVLQPSGETSDELPTGTVYPVTMPISEALEGIRVTLFHLAANKRQALALLPRIDISLTDFQLIYHPFNPGRRELIHSRLGLTVDRTAMYFGAQL